MTSVLLGQKEGGAYHGSFHLILERIIHASGISLPVKMVYKGWWKILFPFHRICSDSKSLWRLRLRGC